jgi:hypothetical protein
MRQSCANAIGINAASAAMVVNDRSREDQFMNGAYQGACHDANLFQGAILRPYPVSTSTLRHYPVTGAA